MSEKSTILIVDDDPSILALVEDFLKGEGYVTEIAENGIAALELFKKEQIDVAVIDLKMPGIDGVELCRRIKKANSRTEVIIITGFPSTESAVAALREGAFDYIIKPFELVEISHRVKQAVERQQLLNERERFIEDLAAANRKLKKRV